MSAPLTDTCDCDSDRGGQPASAKRPGRGKLLVRLSVVCAILVAGAVSFLLKGRSDEHPAPFPLITGEPGPLPYDETGEPRVFVGSPDAYEALRKVYLDSLGRVNDRALNSPTPSKADEDRVSNYKSLAYGRKYQSEDALKLVGSRIRKLEDQLHRSRLHPQRLWHTGLMSDERIVEEMARILKDRRAHEIVFRLGDDLARAIGINYVGEQPPSTDSNRDANRSHSSR